MSIKKSKKPKKNVSKIDNTNESESLPPRFSFRYLSKDSKYGYESLEKDHKVDLINKIVRLSQYTWAELRHLDRHKLGSEKIDKTSLNINLPEVVTEDTNILAFRFSGMITMLGFRSTWGTFYVIGFDSKFTAYKH